MTSPVVPIVVGALVGGGLGYLVLRDERIAAAASKAIETARLPEPSFAMALPRTAAEYEILQGVVCDCIATYVPEDPGEPPAAHMHAGALSEDEYAAGLTLCVGKRLYSKFPWPPMSGDHPTATMLWNTIDVLVRRSLGLGECGTAKIENPSQPNYAICAIARSHA
jgi:hypothetical protein